MTGGAFGTLGIVESGVGAGRGTGCWLDVDVSVVEGLETGKALSVDGGRVTGTVRGARGCGGSSVGSGCVELVLAGCCFGTEVAAPASFLFRFALDF